MTWLDTFLPRLRCAHTGEPLRLASDDDKKRAGLAMEQPALVCESGVYVYPVIEGIPHLLPDAAIKTSTAA